MARDCPHSLPLYLGFLAMVVIAPAQQVVRDQHSPGIIDRGIVIPAASFSREQAIRIARDFLQKEAKGASIARLLIAPDERSLNENYAHGTPHNTYQSTLADIERLGMPKGPMARLLAIRGQGKFSYLENGELTEEILSSFSDPTIFRDEEHSYELLHFTLTRTRFRGDPYFLTVYLKASPDVSISSCVRIYKSSTR